MRHAFPYRFEPQESGDVLVQFVDVPEAHSSGPSEAEAGGEHALDCLIAALGRLHQAGLSFADILSGLEPASLKVLRATYGWVNCYPYRRGM